jgi:hypothetical protein
MSAAAQDLEPLAGMAFLNGVPVRLDAVAGATATGREAVVVAAV